MAYTMQQHMNEILVLIAYAQTPSKETRSAVMNIFQKKNLFKSIVNIGLSYAVYYS